MNNLCVFCGSGKGLKGIYQSKVFQFGQLLSRKNITLVFGGSKVGLMGVLADSILQSGGKCIGVIPKSIADMEIAHENLTKLYVVKNMHERKLKMAELSDGFVALPGGFGTLDELSEVLTYSQLRIYDKPVGILNIHGYFDHLLRFLDHSVHENFIRKEHRNNLMVSENAERLIELLTTYEPVQIENWISEIKNESSINYKNK